MTISCKLSVLKLHDITLIQFIITETKFDFSSSFILIDYCCIPEARVMADGHHRPFLHLCATAPPWVTSAQEVCKDVSRI